MTPRALLLALCCTVAPGAILADDGPAPPPEAPNPMPHLLAADAEGARLDAAGKLWAWRVFKDRKDPPEPDAAWLEPDRAEIAKAYAAADPCVVKGAAFLAADGAVTAWRVRKGQALWLYDGKTWHDRELAGEEGTLDGSTLLLKPGCMVFGTFWGLLCVRGSNITWTPVLPPEARAHKELLGALSFAQDQAGAWYTYSESYGSIWRLEPTEAGISLREIPVLDSVEAGGVGRVARHPDGTKENPRLLAGGVLLEKGALDPPAPAGHEELAGLTRALASETYSERERASKILREDGDHGAWRYTSLLLNAKMENAEPEFRSQVLQGVLDRIKRFEPGRSRDYARKLAAMGVLDKAFARSKGANYKNLWIALEEMGYWNRETRVGFERDRHEARLELRNLNERVHNRFVMPFPVGGEWNQAYACKELYDNLDGVSWMDEIVDAWEDKPAHTLWLAMGQGGVWRVTDEALASRSIVLSDPAARGRLNALRILGRDGQGRLLVLGTLVRATLENKEWKEAPAQRGVWALKEPRPEPDHPAEP